MANAEYLYGSDEYVEFDIECRTVGYVFVPADFTFTACLVPIDDEYNADTAVWATAEVLTEDDVFTGQVLLSDILDPFIVGIYHLYVTAVPTGGNLQNPRLMSKGHVRISDPLNLAPRLPAGIASAESFGDPQVVVP